MPSLPARALLVLALLIAPASAHAYQRVRMVVVVDQRLAGVQGELGPAVAAILTSKGYDVLAGPKVEAFIRDQGIDRVDQERRERIAALLRQFRADTLLVVRVTFFLPEGDRKVGPRANAAVGVAAERRDSTGRVSWRSTASVLGDELARAGSSAAPRTLLSLASERVLWSMPRAPEDPALVALREEQKRKAMKEQQERTLGRRTPDPQRVEALLKKTPSFRTGPKFRLRLNKMRFRPDGGTPEPAGEQERQPQEPGTTGELPPQARPVVIAGVPLEEERERSARKEAAQRELEEAERAAKAARERAAQVRRESEARARQEAERARVAAAEREAQARRHAQVQGELAAAERAAKAARERVAALARELEARAGAPAAVEPGGDAAAPGAANPRALPTWREQQAQQELAEAERAAQEVRERIVAAYREEMARREAEAAGERAAEAEREARARGEAEAEQQRAAADARAERARAEVEAEQERAAADERELQARAEVERDQAEQARADAAAQLAQVPGADEQPQSVPASVTLAQGAIEAAIEELAQAWRRPAGHELAAAEPSPEVEPASSEPTPEPEAPTPDVREAEASPPEETPEVPTDAFVRDHARPGTRGSLVIEEPAPASPAQPRADADAEPAGVAAAAPTEPPRSAPAASAATLSPAALYGTDKRDVAPTLRKREEEPLPSAEKLLPGNAGARQLQAAVLQKQKDVTRCVDGQLKRMPATSADATVLITVDKAGRVTAIALDAGKLKGSYFEQCLRSTALKTWVFPYSGAEYDLELPIQIVATD